MSKRENETQNLAAAAFRDFGWMAATPAGKGVNGVDILNLGGLSVEVKGVTSRVRFDEWLRQAQKRPGLPVVVWRPPGYGPASVLGWPMMLRFGDGLRLLAVEHEMDKLINQ